MQKRARKGGETGINGEFYTGGEFLPSTEQPSRHRARGKAPRIVKEQVAPYKWEVAPAEGMRAIYHSIAGLWGKEINGRLVINASAQTFEYYRKDTAAIERLRALAERYNNGERWATQEEVYG